MRNAVAVVGISVVEAGLIGSAPHVFQSRLRKVPIQIVLFQLSDRSIILKSLLIFAFFDLAVRLILGGLLNHAAHLAKFGQLVGQLVGLVFRSLENAVLIKRNANHQFSLALIRHFKKLIAFVQILMGNETVVHMLDNAFGFVQPAKIFAAGSALGINLLI